MPNRTPRVVLLVGGDEAAAQSRAREMAPLPVVRAKHLGIASDRSRSMLPVAVAFASDVTADDARELERLAKEQATKVVRLDDTTRVPVPARTGPR